MVGDFNFPNIDLDGHSANGLDGVESVKHGQGSFLR